MAIRLYAAAAAALVMSAAMSTAAEIKVLASNGTRGPVTELGRQFEAATGHKLVMDFDVVVPLKRRIDGGESFDVAILSPAAIDDLIKQGKAVAASKTSIGRTGLAVGTRKGAAKPEIGSADAFKRAMLDATSVAYSKEGGSGASFLAVLDRLGIAADMKSKLKTYEVGGPVATTLAQFVVSGAAPIMAMPDTELVGWLPAEIQTYVLFAGAVGSSTKDPEAAKALVRFLTAPAAAPAYSARGVEPAAR